MNRKPRAALACLVLVAATGALANQDKLPEPTTAPPKDTVQKAGAERPGDFGTSLFYSAIEGAQMQPRLSSMTYELGSSSGAYYCTAGGATSVAYGQFFLPHGVRTTGMRVWMYDGDSANQAIVALQSVCLPDFSAADPTVTQIASVSSGTAFNGGFFSAFDSGVTVIDNQSCTYRVRATVGTPACSGASADLGVYKARIEWERFIPPAPASATFNDVPTSDPFFQVIEALADTGVTAGCGGGNFCPTQPVTRAAMAAFLARALGLAPQTITDPANP